MKKIKKSLPYYLFLAVILTSCSTSSFENNEDNFNKSEIENKIVDPPFEPLLGDYPQNVYTGGTPLGFANAYTFLNGTSTILQSCSNIEVKNIYSDGIDLYSVGACSSGGPTVWKNGQIFSQFSAPNGGKATGIALYNGNVYVVGYKFFDRFKAVLWINGVENVLPVPLTTLSIHGFANSISITPDGKVCIGGKYDNKSCLWINNTFVSLSMYESEIYGLDNSGSTLVAVGYEKINSSANKKAVRWNVNLSNNSITYSYLSNGLFNCVANSVSYDEYNNLWYIVGNENTNSSYPNVSNQANLWRGATKFVLGTGLNSTANAIDTFEGHTYVVGESSYFPNGTGTIWIDQDATQGNISNTSSITLN